MNEQLLTALGIEISEDLKDILSALEDKQFEYLERLETVSDEDRKKELTDVLKQIDDEISVIKEKIKDLSSSVILDTDGISEEQEISKAEALKREKEAEREKKKAETEAEKVKKKAEAEAVKNKVEELKNKEAEKQAKEAEKQAREEARKAEKQSANTANTTSQPAVGEVSSEDSEFEKGLKEYKKQNYPAAFSIFKELSEKGDKSAQYLISIMYNNGLGVPADHNRALFWLKKSAEAGETTSQFMYGSYLLANHGGDQKTILEGYKHLGAAADKGDEPSMNKYVDAARLGLGTKNEFRKAIKYCDRLKAASDDSYNKQAMDTAKKQLKSMCKSSTSNSYSRTRKKGKLKKLILFLIIAGVLYSVLGPSIKEYVEKARSTVTETEQENALETGETDGSEALGEAVVLPEGGMLRITAGAGNIRSGAGTEHEILTTANQGQEFIMTGNSQAADNGTVWYEIYLDDTKETLGWASEKIFEVIE